MFEHKKRVGKGYEAKSSGPKTPAEKANVVEVMNKVHLPQRMGQVHPRAVQRPEQPLERIPVARFRQ